MVKDPSGKGTCSVIFIECEERLKNWENHFKYLLNVTSTSEFKSYIEGVYDTISEIQIGEFKQAEVDAADQQMKSGKAVGINEICIPCHKPFARNSSCCLNVM